MTWRLAQSLVVLRSQIDAMFPDRDKRTDGVISGYPGAISGHNVNAAGVVCAMDITTGDYPGGITMAQSYPLADAIRNELLVAPRGLYTYIIHHMEPPYVPSPGPYIAHGGPASLWQWIPYAGTDPHTSHIHISVDEDIPTGGTGSGEDPYDMTNPWNLGTVTAQSGTITPIQEDDMPYTEQQLTGIFKAALDDWSMNTRNFDGNRNLLDTFKQLRAENVITQAAVKAIPQAILFDARVNGRNIFDNFNMLSDNDAHLMVALASIAEAIGALKNAPATNAAPLDIKALAAELAPLLTTNQAHQFIVALGQALPKE